MNGMLLLEVGLLEEHQDVLFVVIHPKEFLLVLMTLRLGVIITIKITCLMNGTMKEMGNYLQRIFHSVAGKKFGGNAIKITNGRFLSPIVYMEQIVLFVHEHKPPFQSKPLRSI